MKYYLTTPIYYVNAAPHLGTAYSTVIPSCASSTVSTATALPSDVNWGPIHFTG